LDVWLNVACLFKTRSQAKQACESGRVTVNGTAAKPHHQLQLNDQIELRQQDWDRIVIVQKLRDKSLAKAEARLLYDDVTPPRPKLDLVDRILRSPAAPREKGAGRPTKRERREIDKLQDK
jgi:ribosome-associated heat shock protein Hsp15